MRSAALVGLGFLLGLAAGLFVNSRDDPSQRVDSVSPKVEARLAALERSVDRLVSRLDRPARSPDAPPARSSDEAQPARPADSRAAPDAEPAAAVPPTDAARLQAIGEELARAFATDRYAAWRTRMEERFLLRPLGELLAELGRPHRVLDDNLYYHLPDTGDGKDRRIVFRIGSGVVMAIRVSTGR